MTLYWRVIQPRCKISVVQTISSEPSMHELLERIRRDGKNPGNGILKVGGFINHQVDPALMEACGRQRDAIKNIVDVNITTERREVKTWKYCFSLLKITPSYG
jgi:hypothetical protein